MEFVSIYNLALSHIGETAATTSPDEQSEERKACEAFYPIAKNKLLELHDWSFASRTEPLAKLAETETFGWGGAYALPANCLRLQFLRDATRMRPSLYYPIDRDYEVRAKGTGRILYTDCENPVAGFIAGDTSEALFSPSFSDALAWLLATYIAGERIKGKEGASFAQTCQQRYLQALTQAKTLDASMMQVHMPYKAPWMRAR